MSVRRALATTILAAFAVALSDGRAGSQAEPPTAGVVDLVTIPSPDPVALVLAVDADDDDEDGEVDAEENERIPEEDLRELEIRARGSVRVSVEGGIRLVRDGRPLAIPATLGRRELTGATFVQGTRASAAPRDAAIVLESGNRTTRVPVTVVGISFLADDNRRIDPRTDALGVSHGITNDATLARSHDWARGSRDPDDVRIEIFDPRVSGNTIEATLVSEAREQSRPTAARSLVLSRPREGLPFRSHWIRLVGDVMDQEAPGVGDRVLRVGLRGTVRLRYEAPSQPQAPERVVEQSVRVGRPGDEDGARAARRAHLAIRVVRHRPGGVPAVGGDDAGALRIARDQVRIANEIWLQCFVDFGSPAEADVRVVDPPPPALLAIADGSGLPAAGDGVVRLRAGGRPIRPVQMRAGAPPIQTALEVAEALSALGLRTTVTENPPAEFGANASADIVVRDARGAPVRLEPDGDVPLSGDSRQDVRIGAVDLSDGLLEFDNMTAAAGTLEERTLLKLLMDTDPRTIELFVVNRFTAGTRQGEAFIESDGNAIVNAVVLDRNGVRQEREAWTQSHEVGHILLDQPFHPDNVGPDRPWLLMDADSSQGLVTGPKRLTWEECHRVHTRSGIGAEPALLRRLDERPATPRATARPFDPGYAR